MPDSVVVMSHLTSNQPEGTPTWIDLAVPDLERGMDFYRALFGWEYTVASTADGRCATSLLRGLPVAGLAEDPDPAEPRWTVYLATDDCDAAADRVTGAGGTLLTGPVDVGDDGRMAVATDPSGARFGLWQGRTHIGCRIVNEPDSLVRNDLVTATPGPAREFYTAVFGFTLDGNDDLPGADFTFLRRPDGKEIGGIFGSSDATSSAWATAFEVADTDALLERASRAGGVPGAAEDSPYGRFATLTDPFGTEFSVIARY